MGLFGNIADTGTVRNLAVSGVKVTGNQTLGAIAGYSTGKIQRVAVKGITLIDGLTNSGYVGGVLGHLYKPGRIEESYSVSSVTIRSAGGYYNGGIVGYAQGVSGAGNSVTIANNYSHASITGTGGNFGGISGYTVYAVTKYNYFAGIANDTVNTDSERGVMGGDGGGGTITDNYFDSDVCASASGYCASAGITGVTGMSTTNIQNKSNFSAGWDFSTIWLEPGGAYMTLRNAP